MSLVCIFCTPHRIHSPVIIFLTWKLLVINCFNWLNKSWDHVTKSLSFIAYLHIRILFFFSSSTNATVTLFPCIEIIGIFHQLCISYQDEKKKLSTHTNLKELLGSKKWIGSMKKEITWCNTFLDPQIISTYFSRSFITKIAHNTFAVNMNCACVWTFVLVWASAIFVKLVRTIADS